MDLSKSYEYFQPDQIDGRVHIIGCGSVGSTLAENLARCGVTKFTLWDFDLVEPHNIVNQIFRLQDVNRPKTEALLDILCEINPDIRDETRLKSKGWNGEQLSGFVFLCVDNIELRKKIVEQHMDNLNVRAMFDFRTRLEDAQHYAADWSDPQMKEDFYNTMNFTHDEAAEETPTSACGITLGVCPTVRIICAYGVCNFMNFCKGKPMQKVVLADAFRFDLMAFQA